MSIIHIISLLTGFHLVFLCIGQRTLKLCLLFKPAIKLKKIYVYNVFTFSSI
jgi:hypothetical protein